MSPLQNRRRPAWPWGLALAIVAWTGRWLVDRWGRPQLPDAFDRRARRDPLTGVGNRVVFRDRLDHALARSERSDQHVAVLFLDIDHFKNVNDQFGHEVGDEVLRVVATRLQAISRRGDTLARLGGDEFTLVLEDLDDAAGAATVAQKILDAMEEPIEVNGRSVSVTVSVGVAITPDDGNTSEELVQHADQAMYSAKSAGRRRYQFSTSALREQNEARVRMVRELREAIDSEDLRLLYQPQIDLATGAVEAVEALVRWVRPDGHDVPAGAFIDVAEETELMQPLTVWVLRHACTEAARWSEDALRQARVTVNLSPSQFGRTDLDEVIADVLAASELQSRRLELEITEQALSTRPDLAAEQLHTLAAMGLTLSVDDFGTGHSSLRNLERFPLHALKIAAPLVAADDTQIPEAIVELARRFGLSTVAEGVETEAQLRRLRVIGCDRVQGFHITPPLSGEALEQWARNHEFAPRADAG